MVETARRAGATAKFAGSGGAVVGTYPDEATYARLSADLLAVGSKTVKPRTQAETEHLIVMNPDTADTNGPITV